MEIRAIEDTECRQVVLAHRHVNSIHPHSHPFEVLEQDVGLVIASTRFVVALPEADITMSSCSLLAGSTQ